MEHVVFSQGTLKLCILLILRTYAGPSLGPNIKTILGDLILVLDHCFLNIHYP